MKIVLATAALAVVSCLLAATRTAANASPPEAPLASLLAGANHHAATVRAEYMAFDGRIARTVCHLTNTSVSETVVLKQVLVLGANGASSILAIHNALFNVSLPPLASVDLAIDNGIAGVVQQTTATSGNYQLPNASCGRHAKAARYRVRARRRTPLRCWRRC